MAHLLSVASLIALIALCLLWETVLAPLRPGGSALMFKALPLLAPLFGILRGKIYTYQWTSLLALAYFCEGVVRAMTDPPPSRWYAVAEVTLALLLFGACLVYVKQRRNA